MAADTKRCEDNHPFHSKCCPYLKNKHLVPVNELVAERYLVQFESSFCLTLSLPLLLSLSLHLSLSLFLSVSGSLFRICPFVYLQHLQKKINNSDSYGFFSLFFKPIPQSYLYQWMTAIIRNNHPRGTCELTRYVTISFVSCKNNSDLRARIAMLNANSALPNPHPHSSRMLFNVLNIKQ